MDPLEYILINTAKRTSAMPNDRNLVLRVAISVVGITSLYCWCAEVVKMLASSMRTVTTDMDIQKT
eukprot:2519550-Amphidinium_carterae.1